ncbi:MAG: acetoacetate decarboxylase family protein [Saprospiraceae bacterium]|nr:acetoacetate decarboxylase family protein [Saprospiraceae bacterium]
MTPTPSIAPAPWDLRGDGYMLFYKFSPEWVARHGYLPPALNASFDGFLSTLMLVNYTSSPVGPYRELLFIPGKFRTPQGRRQSITRIVVDSEASTLSGRANWGIPKHTHPFHVEKDGNTEHIEVLDEHGTPGFAITLRAGGLHFPVTTTLIPIRLYQIWEGRVFLSTPKGSGKGQLATLLDLQINPAFFPDVSSVKPLLALKVSSFKMKFPVSTTI